MTLHLTGGRVIGIVDGKDVGKNSPGHRWRASTNNSPIRTLRRKGTKTFESRLLLAFWGQMNTSRESPVTKSVCVCVFVVSVFIHLFVILRKISIFVGHSHIICILFHKKQITKQRSKRSVFEMGCNSFHYDTICMEITLIYSK